MVPAPRAVPALLLFLLIGLVMLAPPVDEAVAHGSKYKAPPYTPPKPDPPPPPPPPPPPEPDPPPPPEPPPPVDSTPEPDVPGPNGEVPPNMRPVPEPETTPEDKPQTTPEEKPEETPEDPQPPTETPTDEGEAEPTPPFGRAPRAPRAPTDPTGGPRAGTPGQPRGAIAARRSGPHWEHWWIYNRDRFLAMRAIPDEVTPLAPEEGAADRDAFWREVAVDALLGALRDEHPDPSTAAAVALGKARASGALPRLVPLLLEDGTERTLRESAALALGMIEDDVARDALAAVLGNESEPTRLRAFAAFALGLTRRPETLPVLAKVVRKNRESREVRAAALVALGLLGSGRQTTPLLLDVARDRRRDALERAAAVHALGKLGERDALGAIVDLSTDDNRYVRRAAIQALGRIARPSDTRALRLVAEAAESDRDLLVRAYAAIALGRTGAPRAAVVLSTMVEHPNVSLRGFGAMGLAILGRRNDSEPLRNRIVDFLRPRLSRKGGAAETRGAIAIALGVLGDLPSRPRLLRLVKNVGDPRLRGHAAVALALLRSGDARPVLREVLTESKDPWLLQETALAVGLLGDQEAVERLSALVRRAPSEATQVNAALALGRIGSPAALRSIVEMVSAQDVSAPARGIAAVALGMVLDDRTLPALSVVSEDFDYMLPLASFWELLSIL